MIEIEPSPQSPEQQHTPETFTREKRDALKQLLRTKFDDDTESLVGPTAFTMYTRGEKTHDNQPLTIEVLKQIYDALLEAEEEVQAEWDAASNSERGIGLANELGRYQMEANRLADEFFLRKLKIDIRK